MNFMKMFLLLLITFSMPIYAWCRMRRVPKETTSSTESTSYILSSSSSHTSHKNGEQFLKGIQLKAALIECPVLNNKIPSDEEFNCENKIMVTIHMKPEFGVCPEGMRKVLLIDEVFDAKTKSRAKLMSPYMIELSVGDAILMYPLEFLSVSFITFFIPCISKVYSLLLFFHRIQDIECNNNCTSDKKSNDFELRQKQKYKRNNDNEDDDTEEIFKDLDNQSKDVQKKFEKYIRNLSTKDNGNNSDKKVRDSIYKCECNKCSSCSITDNSPKCECCSRCEGFKLKRSCECPECINVENEYKCDCCNSLLSCDSDICSYNGNSFQCGDGSCTLLHGDYDNNYDGEIPSYVDMPPPLTENEVRKLKYHKDFNDDRYDEIENTFENKNPNNVDEVKAFNPYDHQQYQVVQNNSYQTEQPHHVQLDKEDDHSKYFKFHYGSTAGDDLKNNNPNRLQYLENENGNKQFHRKILPVPPRIEYPHVNPTHPKNNNFPQSYPQKSYENGLLLFFYSSLYF